MKKIVWTLLFLLKTHLVFATPHLYSPLHFYNYDHPYLTPSFHHQLDQLTRSHLSAGNTLELLTDDNSYKKKLEMVNSSKFSILMVVMSFECGETGQEMSEALISAKKRGVDVRLIIDGMYAKVIPLFKKCYKQLEKNGVQVAYSPCLLYTSPSPRDRQKSRMPSSA